MRAETGAAVRWIVVVPFKGAPHGKSRLGPPVDGGATFESGRGAGFSIQQRAELALAFLRDTIEAVRRARGVELVLVVSSADELRSETFELDASVLDASELDASVLDPFGSGAYAPAAGSDASGPSTDPSSEPDDTRAPVELVADPKGGLNPAVASGLAAARERDPGAWVAALTGDLPSLRTTDVEQALALAESHPRSVVADHDGTGTTMITAAPATPIEPQFGVGSFAAHAAAGQHPLSVGSGSTLRFDVDSVADLHGAMGRASGLGAHTRMTLVRFESAGDESDDAEHARNESDQ